MKTVTPQNKYTYWQWLRSKHHHYSRLCDTPDPDRFCDWVEQQFGIQIELNSDGYGQSFTVVDDKKYLMVVLDGAFE